MLPEAAELAGGGGRRVQADLTYGRRARRCRPPLKRASHGYGSYRNAMARVIGAV
jgi:hypothetical protein